MVTYYPVIYKSARNKKKTKQHNTQYAKQK